MQQATIRIGSQQWVLKPNADVDQLKNAALEAVRHTGLIEFTAVGDRHISAVVSAGVSVLFDLAVELEETVGWEAADADRTDVSFDLYLEDLSDLY